MLKKAMFGVALGLVMNPLAAMAGNNEVTAVTQERCSEKIFGINIQGRLKQRKVSIVVDGGIATNHPLVDSVVVNGYTVSLLAEEETKDHVILNINIIGNGEDAHINGNVSLARFGTQKLSNGFTFQVVR